jgi:S1-C subfamily serine protease
MRTAIPLVLLAALATPVPAQEGLKADKVAAVKAASVYVRTHIEQRKFTGSGFVVAADATSILIATNAHVVTLDEYAKLPPVEALAKLRAAKVNVLFDSGTATERGADAEIVAFDPVVDLAILKIKTADVKNPPKPLAIDSGKVLSETATVYTLGFPFGDALARGKGPAITVGKATISSLRTDDAGKLATIQIDGNLNPGNSGGAVVDSDGAVVGVAVAILRDSQGIGFAIPVAEVRALLEGKATLFRAEFKKEGTGAKVKLEALVSNAQGKVTGLEIDYAVVAPDAVKPKPDADVRKLPGAKTVALKLDGTIAKGELALDKIAGQFVYSVRPVGPKDVAVAPLTAVSLARAVGGNAEIDPDAKPPAGWKEIGSNDKYITIWVPEKSGKPAESLRTTTSSGARLSFTSLQTTGDNGVSYSLERSSIILTGPGATGVKLNAKVVRESLVQNIADEMKGKVTEETDAKLGTWQCKEYVIKAGATTSVVRIVVLTRTIYICQVRGPDSKVLADEGSLFLNSMRFHPKDPAAVAGGGTTTPGPVTPPPMPPKPVGPPKSAFNATQVAGLAPNGETQIVGGGEQVFRDYAPEGGMLIGFEFAVGKPTSFETVTGVKPIYRTKDGEKEGKAQGIMAGAVTVKAKEGYAVGAVIVQRNPFANGLAVVFMKVIEGGKLDPKDNYESEWIGSNVTKRRDVQIGGSGESFIGVVGKANAQQNFVTGLGLIFDTPEAAKARKTSAVGTATAIKGSTNGTEFKDTAPDGALLVGLEISIQKLGQNEMIRAFRPIYREGDKEPTLGVQRGTNVMNVVKVVAKPGYAVAAITLKARLHVDGISITFMKVKDGMLDAKDSYESDWVGGQGTGTAEKLGGDGTPIIGIVGKTNARDATALGLLKK